MFRIFVSEMRDMKKEIKWNWSDIRSIKKAERLKAKLENDGYRLVNTITNRFTDECKMIYRKAMGE